MRCRVCQGEIAFVTRDGRQVAAHAEGLSQDAGSNVATPSPGQQRKLRQKLEEECRQARGGVAEGAAVAPQPAMRAPEAPRPEPQMYDDVKSVQDTGADQEKEEFKTFTV
jgi:hypothetical protein